MTLRILYFKRQLSLACRHKTYLWRHPTNNSPTESNRCSDVAKKKLSFQMKFIFILADAYIEKPTHPKRVTVWCGFFGAEAQLAQFSSKMSEERSLQSMEIVIGPSWMTFCSQKLKSRILATFGFNRTALRATQLKLHSIFCALFLEIVLSATELMSFGHLGTAIWHRWTIICGVPSKISVTPTSQRQLTL